jgi:hypothetical protein
MKRLIFISICLTILFGCSTKIIYEIETASTGILYKGVENAIHIKSDSKSTLNLTIDNGTIEKIDTSLYYIKVDNFLATTLTIKQGKKEKKLKFRVNRIPVPKIIPKTDYGEVSDNESNANEFKTFQLLSPRLSFPYNCRLAISSYTLTRIDSNGKRETRTPENPMRGPNPATYLAKKTKSGDIYIFSNINVVFWLQNNSVKDTIGSRKLDDYVIRIK